MFDLKIESKKKFRVMQDHRPNQFGKISKKLRVKTIFGQFLLLANFSTHSNENFDLGQINIIGQNISSVNLDPKSYWIIHMNLSNWILAVFQARILRKESDLCPFVCEAKLIHPFFSSHSTFHSMLSNAVLELSVIHGPRRPCQTISLYPISLTNHPKVRHKSILARVCRKGQQFVARV